MELYKIGKVVSLGKTYIILESNSTGHIINVPRVSDYEKDKTRKIFVYNHKTDYSESLYGFSSFAERLLFEDLISLNGIGPKTAVNLLKDGYEKISEYIANGDVELISKFPSLGVKTASQIVLELSEKYKNFKTKQNSRHSSSEVVESLKTLGFNQKQIDYAITKISPSNSLEEMVESSIRLIADAKFA